MRQRGQGPAWSVWVAAAMMVAAWGAVGGPSRPRPLQPSHVLAGAPETLVSEAASAQPLTPFVRPATCMGCQRRGNRDGAHLAYWTLLHWGQAEAQRPAASWVTWLMIQELHSPRLSGPRALRVLWLCAQHPVGDSHAFQTHDQLLLHARPTSRLGGRTPPNPLLLQLVIGPRFRPQHG